MPSVGRIKFPHIEQPSLRERVQSYFMTIFCGMYLFVGSAVITCGALVLRRQQHECGFMGRYYSGACLLLAAGCFTAFFSIVGCLQTRRSRAPHYYTSLLLVLVVVIFVELAAAVTSHIMYALATDEHLMNEMMEVQASFWTSSSSSQCVETIQTQFRCCGASNYTEWLTIYDNTTQNNVFPPSCICERGESQCDPETFFVGNASEVVSIFTRACYSPLLNDLYESLLMTRIIGPAAMVLKGLFLLMVIFFLHHVNNRSLVGAYVVKRSNSDTPVTADLTVPASTPEARAAGSRWVEIMQRRQDRPTSQTWCQGHWKTRRSRESLSLSREETAEDEIVHM